MYLSISKYLAACFAVIILSVFALQGADKVEIFRENVCNALSGSQKRIYDYNSSVTFDELSRFYEVPVGYLYEKVGVPAGISPFIQVENSMSTYRFSLSDLDRAIVGYRFSRGQLIVINGGNLR